MYSSEDLERFYFQYQCEALPHGESLQSFCVKHKEPYNIFQKWYKDTRNKIVEVKVDGAPTDEDGTRATPSVKPHKSSGSTDNPVRIWIDIRISNGLHLSQKNLSYHDLVRMVEDQKDRFIQYLAEQHRQDELTRKAMEQVLEDLMCERKLINENRNGSKAIRIGRSIGRGT